ncbi:acidic phosphoprotein-like [Dendrobium catenatum]|uniref:acidic phosphoprotein-like n=1 Tax=Dendrobium catenatum TaxID=906689 RepID=UPI0009F312AE|nr:acidic phosphoprotein-like [Dendrobium catenatum]
MEKVVSVYCDCCGFKEKCTHEYISQVKANFEEKWLCGICSEAVREEMMKGNRTIEDALKALMSVYRELKAKNASIANGSWSGDRSASTSSSSIDENEAEELNEEEAGEINEEAAEEINEEEEGEINEQAAEEINEEAAEEINEEEEAEYINEEEAGEINEEASVEINEEEEAGDISCYFQCSLHVE